MSSENTVNMEIHFLGTGSALPSPSRGVSALALVFDDRSTWLFDCGEGTQIQLQKSNVSFNKIQKIFITHLHGDHIFGLPGLLATLSLNRNDDKKYPTLHIYGPVGLEKFISTSLVLSHSTLCFSYEIHELVPVVCQYSSSDDFDESLQSLPDTSNNHLLYPVETNGDFTWNLFDNETVNVTAGWITHRVPSFGYVIYEKNKPGKLLVDKLKSLGIPVGPICGKLKSGENIIHEGQIIESKNFMGPPIPGQKIVICGDTSDATHMAHLTQGCDVLIHEATHDNKLLDKAIEYGHSTPSIAVNTAKLFEAKVLLLNHFSQRYRSDAKDGEDSIDTLLQQALNEAIGTKMEVICSHDFYIYKVK